MGSKGIVSFGMLLAMVLLVSSEVAARQLAEISNTINTSKKDKKINAATTNDAKYPYYGTVDDPTGPPQIPSYRTTPPCVYNCNKNPYGGEKADAEVQAKPHN